MKKKWYIVILVICLIQSVGCAKDSLQYVNSENDSGSEVSRYEACEARDVIRVHISGEVYFPGVYTVSADSRIYEVVRKAGGFTSDADTDRVNQAKKVSDGEKITIPSVKEQENNQSDTGYVNINSANEESLCTLPGIGTTRARQILEYRNEHGDFQKIEDIMNVTGIKEGLFEKIAPYITVS